MTELVTGEAVALELRLAKFASRALALAIDLAVQWCLLLGIIFLAAGGSLAVDSALGAAISLTLTVAVIVGYPVTFETLTRGRSLGKMALGLRVVREDGGPIRFRQAFVRGLLGVVELWISFGSIALIASLASTQGRRIGDHLAGTVVVRERVPAQAGAVADMPPSLRGWAATLDLTRLPDDLALAARQYIGRAPELAPHVRDGMGASLASAIAAITTPPPPPGVPPWAFLSAVLAERRRRETERLGSPPPAALTGWSAPPPPPPTYQPGARLVADDERPDRGASPPAGPFAPPS